ncbi:hypothetical protein [Corynebacterium glucuronolyticum]|uniref:hypothetical protein n=1 Tax=Corynebacterium glucuronolyticum TaxID=39791 RepID=UPI00223C3DFC|nr:hypothetical protein [Corynebacterium glucuronolyticum]MCT1443286.1 hypothetical protein [Corynebacterium glucuronolyticum]
MLDEPQAAPDDLDLETFKVALKRYEKTDLDKLVRVVLRTGRKVSHGTGTLLSPDDRDLADNGTPVPIVILYRIEGVNCQRRR